MNNQENVIRIRDCGSNYIARWRGKTASCTYSAEVAARSVARKIIRNCEIKQADDPMTWIVSEAGKS